MVRSVDDVDLRERTRSLQILVQRLRAFDGAGQEYTALDADDRSASLRLAPDDDGALRDRAIAAGSSGDIATLRYLLRRQRREAALWGRLMERRR